jgi:trans-aconitate methyltransferase
MQLTEAIELIKHPAIGGVDPQNWADIGCGSGLFTKALGSLLSPTSVVYAVDTQPSIPAGRLPNKVKVAVINADFANESLMLPKLNGILMANSLHYVKDKSSFVAAMLPHLTQESQFLIVEYNTNIANRWVPYPIDFSSLKKLFEGAGFTSVEKINERSSIYNQAKMYSAVIRY